MVLARRFVAEGLSPSGDCAEARLQTGPKLRVFAAGQRLGEEGSAGKDDAQPFSLQSLAKFLLQFFPGAVAEEVFPGEFRFPGDPVLLVTARAGFHLVDPGDEVCAVTAAVHVHEIPDCQLGGGVVAPTARAIGSVDLVPGPEIDGEKALQVHAGENSFQSFPTPSRMCVLTPAPGLVKRNWPER